MNATPIRVVIIEDSDPDLELSLVALKAGGFEVSCERAQGEEDLRRALRAAPPQVVLSDFSVPGFAGMEALRLARELAPDVPFIFVSGTIGEEPAIEAARILAGRLDEDVPRHVGLVGRAVLVRQAGMHRRDADGVRVRGRLAKVVR